MANLTSANVTLEELNYDEIIRRLPVLVYLVLILLIGLPGNICVLVIFTKHYKEQKFGVYRVFVLALAALDTVACSFCLPFEMTDTVRVFTFYDGISCKILRSLELAITMSTIFVILCLTVYRYRKICHYKRTQLTEKMAKLFSILSVVVSVILCWPVVLYTGIKKIELPQNITGHDCFFLEDSTSKTILKIHGGFGFGIYVLISVTIIILYLLIGKKMNKQESLLRRFRHSFKNSKSKGSATNQEITPNKIPIQYHKNTHSHEDNMPASKRQKCNENETGDDENAIGSSYISDNAKCGQDGSLSVPKSSMSQDKNKASDKNKFNKNRKNITGIALAVTVLFIGSYFPLLIVMVIAILMQTLSPDQEESLAGWVPPIIWRLMFLSNIGNPIIYLLFDRKYRGLVQDYFPKLH